MKKLNIAATEKSPKVTFDADHYLFEMEGNSRPENVRDFYYPIIETLGSFFEKYITKKDFELKNETPFKFNFKLDYFNSSSAKFISDILVIVKTYSEKNLNIKIYWYFEDGDEDMKEVGEEFSDMISVPFNYIMISK